jgi:GMP synthase (glutamine-hydrolysing)
MIILVDLEHARLQQDDPGRGAASLANRLRIQYRLEDLSGDVCLTMRYHQVTPVRLAALPVRALLVSGNATEFAHYSAESLAGLRSVLRSAAYPTLAFCGGCQILAESYGATIGPIGALPPDTDDDDAQHPLAPGMIQERGFLPVRVIQPHPLFAGLGEQPIFLESHYWEVKAPPPGFAVYAATAKCAIQMLAHSAYPLYATQFHPEYYDEEHPDGRRLIENFFRLAGVLA